MQLGVGRLRFFPDTFSSQFLIHAKSMRILFLSPVPYAAAGTVDQLTLFAELVWLRFNDCHCILKPALCSSL